MSTKIYNWKRFWCQRASDITFSDTGYLHDPNSPWGRIVNPNVLPFESISDMPCLALLGEPGMGKSYAMQLERAAICARAEQEGDQTLWLDLRSFGSEERLVRSLFESEAFVSWIEGNHRLHLFLDSLDECLLRINTIGSLLVDELKRYSVDRLFLRIACRTADWHSSLEDGLRALWGQDAVGVYELAPLSDRDLASAAEAHELDPGDFRAEIDRREAAPLAMKPVTLIFLLNTYQRTGGFPETRVKLYREGCRLLCEETNLNLRGAQLAGKLTADQRMSIAARIAAVTVLANKYAIWTEIDWGDVPSEDVTVRELVGADVSHSAPLQQVTEPFIREALGTGLFSARGPSRLGWAHQTYAEFLAAWYLAQCELTPDRMMSLLIHPGDVEGKLVPQLYETSAWLASMVPEVFRAIVQTEPEILLRSDVATAESKDKEALVASFLSLSEEQKLSVRSPGTLRQYGKMLHSGLADQLRPYITDTGKDIVTRRTAIEIASVCEVPSLAHDLAAIALDLQQALAVREMAAQAVRHSNVDAAKVKLKPLITGAMGDDPNDELKGCALRSLWPNHITTEELFKALTPPRRESFLGSYALFIIYDLAEGLSPSDLPCALNWVQSQGPWHLVGYCANKLIDRIFRKAWDQAMSLRVAKALGHAILSRVRQFDEIIRDDRSGEFSQSISEDHPKRRMLLDTMLSLVVELEEDPKHLLYTGIPLVLSQDIPWMIERLQSTKSVKEQMAWAQLIDQAFDQREPEQLEAIFDACQANSILADEFAWLLQAVDLNSPRAERMKETHNRIENWRQLSLFFAPYKLNRELV